jgi:hypothetical protein
MFRVALPIFVKVATFAEDRTPTACEVKDIEVGVRVALDVGPPPSGNSIAPRAYPTVLPNVVP